jgi:FlaA1/EpsC-like NDP-sugar epimerase
MADGRQKPNRRTPFRRRVLIAGAGEAGVMISSEIQVHATSRYELVGFVDDDPQKQGRMINKCRVLGTCEDIPVVVSQYDIDEILIAIPSAPGNVIRRISHRALDAQVSFRILPGLLEIIRGDASIRIREMELRPSLASRWSDRHISAVLWTTISSPVLAVPSTIAVVARSSQYPLGTAENSI